MTTTTPRPATPSMAFSVERSLDVLHRTPAVLRSLLHGAGNGWTHGNYGPDTFSPFDVVGHLIHAERTNWMPRLHLILAQPAGGNEPPALPPFDRYAMYEASRGRTMDDLLDTFASLREQSVRDLRALNLAPGQLDFPASHPQVGRVTLRNLIAAWTVHDLGHTHQVAKAMAYQYRDAVGPWREMLTILPPVI